MPPLAAVPDLEHELDELYALPLEEFTRARNDLARRLKRAHQAEAAAEVQAIRKPGLVAWAANRLARSHAEAVAALLEAGAQLQQAQARALAGRGGVREVNEAAQVERDAVRALLAQARTLLGDRATAALLDRLGETLRAAAVDAAARPLLEAGRLTEEVRAVGFGPLTAVRSTGPRRDDDRRARQEELRRLREQARLLAREAAEAERAADGAEREARRLREEAGQRRAAADRAAAALSGGDEPA